MPVVGSNSKERKSHLAGGVPGRGAVLERTGRGIGDVGDGRGSGVGIENDSVDWGRIVDASATNRTREAGIIKCSNIEERRAISSKDEHHTL
jgi:hypothetical protein